MAYNKYYSEGKYKCNHPESDFEKTSTNPIEMKKENFVEYTHRNETANYRYDVWSGSDNISTKYFNDKKVTTLNNYSEYIQKNPYNYNNTTNSRKNNPATKWIILFIALIYLFPAILSIIFSILGEIIDSF